MATVSSKDYREFIEEKEKEYLSPYAALSVNTKGRERPMKPCPIRTDYIRDRDSIPFAYQEVCPLPRFLHYTNSKPHT